MQPDIPPLDSPSRHNRVLIGLVSGAVAGVIANLAGARFPAMKPALNWLLTYVTEPVGQLFLRLLLMTVIPLVVASLIVGVSRIGDIRKLGRIGVRCLVYCVVISAISVGIGLSLANVIRPGERVNPATAAALQEQYKGDASREIQNAKKTATKDTPVMEVVKTLVPSNPLTAMASETPNMLQLLFFTLVFGVALNLIPGPKTTALLDAIEGLYNAAAKIIDLIMLTAPVAVACLLFNNTARFGLDLLQALGWFIVTVLLGLALHMFGTYSIAVRVLSRISPREFFRRIKTVMATAFSTSSSNATLPTTLRVAEENLGVPREISGFVLTVGATANQNGTALYEGVTVLFLAQLAGVDLTLGQQIMVAYLAILGSIGTAGVPSGSIPFIVLVLGTININPALIGIILGVDRILDMCRTTLNVAGDLTAATYVARAEGAELLPGGGSR
ncbi:MAG: dicarboxylate/amino acid:cation symporter [Verrucomicrobia subdivision 3 bacterium]|nr:dicarboxylate/amino acid:cation symporter [Limisphaerales bacterium]